jgi:two-component system, cell cycle sensor histidine kinase and response regulator CckA
MVKDVQRSNSRGLKMAQDILDHGVAEALRKKAEEKIEVDEADHIKALSADEARQLIHELRVHQIELEMQNEELRRAQLELDAARAKYFDLYDLAPVGYMTVSEKGLILEVNLTAVNLLDVARGALVKQPISSFIHKEDQDIYYHHRKRLFDTGKPQVCELRMVKSGGTGKGTLLWAHLAATAVYDADGASVCRVVMSDITKRKMAELKNEKLQLQLQQTKKLEAVGTLAGGIAHQFNNLLQIINGYTQILLMDKSPNDPEYTGLEAIHNAGDRAARLILQFLQFSRKAESERRHVDLNEQVKHARRILATAFPQLSSIELSLDNMLQPIKADSNQIEQLLLNLGTNSAEASPKGGKLIIETRNVVMEEQDTNEYMALPPGPYVLLTVSDTGHGMNREIIEKIFDPFFTTKKFGQGTGLGLASVHGIVKSHGGDIQCDSDIGRGTTFRIYLPAMEPA